MITERIKVINGIEYHSSTLIFKDWRNGRYTKKQPSQFLSNARTRALINKFNNEIASPCYLSFGGSGENAGTWFIKELIPYFYNWLNKLPSPSFTRSEIMFCEILESAFNGVVKFERQKIMGVFMIDLYCESLNLCIEYDEKHHNNKKLYDKKREVTIINNYGCIFIRHSETDNIGVTINKIYGMLAGKAAKSI